MFGECPYCSKVRKLLITFQKQEEISTKSGRQANYLGAKTWKPFLFNMNFVSSLTNGNFGFSGTRIQVKFI